MPDDELLVGTTAAAAAAGVSQSLIAKLLVTGWLTSRRGPTTAKGGRPPHIIERRALLAAIAAYQRLERDYLPPAPRQKGRGYWDGRNRDPIRKLKTASKKQRRGNAVNLRKESE